MKTILDLKNQFISDTESSLKDINEFQSLSENQLNWKPADGVWSIAECIDHLIVTNQLYFNEFEKQFSQKQVITDCSKAPVKNKFISKFIIKSVEPNNLKKVKTFQVFQPASSKHTKEVLTLYSDIQKQLINLITSTKDLNLNKHTMSSPASKLIKENFCDVLEIIRLHDRRHINQAQRVLNNKSFPTK